MRKLALFSLLFFSLMQISAEGNAWSNWAAAYGSPNGIEYRWRFSGACLANGCGKDLQFRNNTSHQLAIKYAAHMERMGDSSNEVIEDGTAILSADSDGNVLPLTLGAKVLRVRVDPQ
jgi:hypothetical protein